MHIKRGSHKAPSSYERPIDLEPLTGAYPRPRRTDHSFTRVNRSHEFLHI